MAEMLTGKTLFPGTDRTDTFSIKEQKFSPFFRMTIFSFHTDIDQLTRIFMLVGKPCGALLEKLGSDEVGAF